MSLLPRSLGNSTFAVPSSAPHLRIGYLTLLDAAPLVLADALGLFQHHGLRVTLHGTGAWAALRDRLAFGALDGAHLLYPMPIAAALGLGQPVRRWVTACGLGRNGNTITLSHAVADAIGAFTPPLEAARFGQFAQCRAETGRPLRIGVVHAYSTHSYLLRAWLELAGLDPQRDVLLEVVPPPLMAEHLASGMLDGFCAGEPWGSHAVLQGAGRIALGTGSIWPDHSEKLLVFSQPDIAGNAEAVIAATAAVIEAAAWLDDSAHHAQAAAVMRQRVFPDLEESVIFAGLAGRALLPEGGTVPLARPLRFQAASFPDPAQAQAWFGRMRRWGDVPENAREADALAPFTTDIWAAAVARSAGQLPPTTSLAEGLPL